MLEFLLEIYFVKPNMRTWKKNPSIKTPH